MKKILSSVFVLGSFVSFAQAGVVAWENPVNGLFFDTSNWLGGNVPGNSDAASFATGSNANYSVSLTGPVTNNNLLISDNLTLDLAGQSYQLTSTDTSNPSIQIGGANATLNLQSTGTPATLASKDAVLAPLANQKATVNLDDSNVTWDVADSLTLGSATDGNAMVNLLAGALDIAEAVNLYSGSAINLAGGTLEMDSYPSILISKPGGTLSLPETNWTGSLVLPHTRLTISTAGDFSIVPVNASLILNNITLAPSANFNIGGTLVAGNFTVAGTTTIAGGTLSANTLAGSGTVNISNTDMSLQSSIFSGTVNIDSGSLQIANFIGSGALNVAGGTVTIQSFAGSGSLHLTGGTLIVTQRWVDAGTIDISGGVVILPAGATFSHSASFISTVAFEHPSLPATLAHISLPGGGWKLLYTWYGDANGDGVVNSSDLAMIAPLGTSDATWSMGDFNDNGAIDIDDYSLLELGAASGKVNISTTLPEPELLAMTVLAAFGILESSKRGRKSRYKTVA